MTAITTRSTKRAATGATSTRRRTATPSGPIDPIQPEAAAPITPTREAAVLPLPPLDAPAVAPQQPAVSYKLAFGDTSSWYSSRDGGRSSEPIASAAIAGAVIDLALQISPSQHRDGTDYRLRLAFMDWRSELAELNLNAVSVSGTGETYVTSPARSLAGALLTISETEDDMRAFCEGTRFSINKGKGRGVFVETDIAQNGRWITCSGAMATLRVSKEPERFCEQLRTIKQRFRSCGFLMNGPAVQSSVEEQTTRDQTQVQAMKI